MERKIKGSFNKVKEDINSLGDEIEGINLHIIHLKEQMKLLTESMISLVKEQKKHQEMVRNHIKTIPTHKQNIPTQHQKTPTHTNIPTNQHPLEGLRRPFKPISTGNGGVPTDRQTNRQTNRHIIQHINPTQNQPLNEETKTLTKSPQINEENGDVVFESSDEIPEVNNDFFKAREILDNLDSIKKGIRRKFKNLTNGEMEVFSLLYNLEVEGHSVDYKMLSERLKLSESSIRDYISKIMRKGIPIIKEKLNNKHIVLHISQDLTKIASLDTILKLREM